MFESWEFKWENDSKSTQDVHFFTFFLEKPLHLKKDEKCYSIFYNENRNTYQFNEFTIKNDLGNMSEMAS